MSTKTTNFNLHKIDLADSPPDITVLNQNFDLLDKELKKISEGSSFYKELAEIGLTDGSETIEAIITAMPENSMLVMGTGSSNNMIIYPDGHYGTLVVIKDNDTRNLFMYQKANNDAFYTGRYYSPDGTWSGWKSYVSTSGGTMTGTLSMKKVGNNGQGEWYKNHSSTDDMGTVMADKDVDENVVQIVARAKDQKVYAKFSNDGLIPHELYGEHNIDALKADIGSNMKTYNDLTQIGLAVGSETIESIATNLPTYSRITLTVGSTNNLSIYPNENFGMMTVEKTVNSRIVYIFTNNQGKQWVGVYSISSNGNTWTDWKEVIIGNLATLVRSLLTGGEISMIKSIQRGVVEISGTNAYNTAIINTVNPSKSFVSALGNTNSHGSSYSSDSNSSTRPSLHEVMLQLTDATTVTASRMGGKEGHDLRVSYEVVEFY
jgi:hypothetical protein